MYANLPSLARHLGTTARRHATIIAALIMALGLASGCSRVTSNGDSSEPEDIPPAVDVSLVDAIAPYDAESQLDEAVLFHRLQQQEYAVLESCIESKGLPPIGLLEELPPINEMRGSALPDFPDLDALESEGFRPLTEDSFWGDEDRNVLSDEQRQAMDECDAEEPELQGAVDLMAQFMHLSSKWWAVLEEVDASEDLTALRSEFTTCALDEGVDSSHAADESAFIGALDALNSRGFDTPEEANQERRELGQIYYLCGADLFELKIDLRLEQRDDFVDEHWDDIAGLSELLFGDDLIESGVSE